MKYILIAGLILLAAVAGAGTNYYAEVTVGTTNVASCYGPVGTMDAFKSDTRIRVNVSASEHAASIKYVSQARVDAVMDAAKTEEAESAWEDGKTGKGLKALGMCFNDKMIELGKTNRITKAEFIENFKSL